MTPGKLVVLLGGTRALVGVPAILGKSAIPFIGLSSGSVSAAGAISGITALPTAYASAYCWFPANALATVKAAGWYYCTFSSTTAGTAYLDAYTPGTAPTIPSSPTPVTDGKGAFTGDITEEFGPSIVVPSNAMGPNGALEISYLASFTNSAGAKTPRIRFSGNAGSILWGQQLGSGVVSYTTQKLITNRGITNSQVSSSINGSAGGIGSAGTAAPVYSAVDTSQQTTVVLSLQRDTATDNAILESFLVTLWSDGT